MQKVLILGADGMLGSMLLRDCIASGDYTLFASIRDDGLAEALLANHPEVKRRKLDAEAPRWQKLEGIDWVINAAGLINTWIAEDERRQRLRAIRINSMFPHGLAEAAERMGFRVIQIGTDCVFSGRTGGYTEESPPDPNDVYGMTKHLGEVPGTNILHLRCSIVGPEVRRKRSLLEWFLGQPKGAVITGYTNHMWNGVTTLQFSRVCRGIIEADLEGIDPQHLVPADAVSKHDLLKLFARFYNREDIQIEPGAGPQMVNRTLATCRPDNNANLWLKAGYSKPPSIEEMVMELSAQSRPDTLFSRG